MNNFQKIILLLYFFIFSGLSAQYSIQPDRPDQSEGTDLLNIQSLQIENGITSNRNCFANELMLRYGILKNTEIRLSSVFNNKLSFLQTTISIKQRIMNGNEWLPSITAIGYMGYISETKKIEPDALLAFSNELYHNLSFDYNIGTTNGFRGLIFTTELNYSPHKNITLFGEYFATFNDKQTPNHNIDIGMIYSVTPSFMIDAMVGHSFLEKYFFFGVGISYNIIK